MIASLFEGRNAVWVMTAGVVGILAGLAVGQSLGSDDADATSPENLPEVVPPTVEPTVSTDPIGTGSVPSPPSTALPLECVGAPLAGGDFVAVIGVSDVGADELAAALATEVVSETFDYLNGPVANQDAFEARALARAGDDPVIFVAKLSPGPFQRRVAQALKDRSPASVVIVVSEGSAPEALTGYPTGSVAVAAAVGDEAPFSDAWVTALAELINGTSSSTCTPIGG